ncbi:hypothetical protein ACFL5Q_07210, partial [Planctomycetota bacterium]
MVSKEKSLPQSGTKGSKTMAAKGKSGAGGNQGPARESTYELGRLNRHWYRRCLDVLGTRLQEAGTTPSLEKLGELLDNVIGLFLTSVTGQAPDSNQPQFPADRAYYIPFEGDFVAKFNYVKPYYQLTAYPHGYPDAAEESLWSFYPWPKQARTKEGRAAKEPSTENKVSVSIDRTESVKEDQTTVTFDEMISPQERFRGSLRQTQAEKQSGAADSGRRGSMRRRGLTVKKSLLVRPGDDRPLRGDRSLNEVFSQQDGEESKDLQEGGAAFRRRFHDLLKTAIVRVFQIY